MSSDGEGKKGFLSAGGGPAPSGRGRVHSQMVRPSTRMRRRRRAMICDERGGWRWVGGWVGLDWLGG